VVLTYAGSSSFFPFSAFAFFWAVGAAGIFETLAASLASFSSLLASFLAKKYSLKSVWRPTEKSEANLRSWNLDWERQSQKPVENVLTESLF
jgi:hypothetical protein